MRTLLFLLMLTTAAAAQQQATPETQALQNRLMGEINANLQCSAALITLQQDNAKLKAENEELKKPK